MGEATAFEYVFVDRVIRKYRVLYGAFECGAVSYTTVRFLLRYITEDNEPYVKITTRDDGMMCFEALLPAVTGQELMAALKLAQLSQYGFDGVEEEELRDPDKVDALLEEAAGVDEACPATQTAEPKPRRTSMWDAIKDTAEAMAGGGTVSRFGPVEKKDTYSAFVTMISMVRSNPKSALRAPGAQVSIMVTEDGRAWIPNNLQAKSEEVEQYVASAMMRLHETDAKGLTLNVGRQQRLATDGQVAALLPAWGHQCAMPGCTHSRFLQMHHLRDWARGGETNVDNLITELV